jgi:putative phosphonate metabolism protein
VVATLASTDGLAMTERTLTRYAIYFAPPRDSILDRFGSRWLGRDAWSDAPLAQPALHGMEPTRLAALTAAPRRYGFHATLKAPFALKDGVTAETLIDALTFFARDRAPIRAGHLTVSDLRGFLALTFAEAAGPVRALADACVEAFQPFARPSTADDIHRRSHGLTARQRANLQRWNYPFVFEEFRFHMTLTDRVDGAERKVLAAALERTASAVLDEPVGIDALTLFIEDRPGSNFRVAGRFPLTGSPPPSY